MAVEGLYMARRVRGTALHYVRAYEECVRGNLMPTFVNLEKKADEVAEAEYERLGNEPVGESGDDDMASAAQAAQDRALAFYETMTALRQSVLNLFAAGLFHLLEQQLAYLCCDGAFAIPPPGDTKVDFVKDWYRQHFGIDLRSLRSWPIIEELRLTTNVVKHAEGSSAEKLRERQPELFHNPLLRQLDPNDEARIFFNPIRSPLAGDDLYVTPEIFQQYSDAADEFLSDIAKHFEAHSDEWYPRD